MKQIDYQGYAQGGGFNPVQVSSASVSRIEKEGARVLRGMQQQAEQDLQNQKAVLQQMQVNQQLEQRSRDRNQNIRLETIKNQKDDNRRDYDIQAGNLQRETESQQTVLKSLSTLSKKATELAVQYDTAVGTEQAKEQYWQDMLYGVNPEDQLKERHTDYQLQIYGEQLDQETDKVQAMGADPVQVDYFRGLNRWQRRGRERAMIDRAGSDFGSWVEGRFNSDNQTEIEIPGPDGTPQKLTPVDAATSAQQAAFFPVLFKQFMDERGLYGVKSARLEPMYLKVRTTFDALTSKTRKIEVQEREAQRISEAQDMVYDGFDSVNVLNYYNVLRRSLDANGMPMGHAAARAKLMDMMFTATDESGNLKFTPSQIEEFGNMVFPGQNRSIKDQYSAQWAEMSLKRSQTENQLYSLQEATKGREFGEWNNQTREWLNSGKWDGSNESLEPLLQKAIRDGNGEGVKMLQTFMTDVSNDGRNDKFYEELWTEKAVQGLLSVEEVRTANVSAKLKLDWLPKAEKSQQSAMPADIKDSMDQYIKSALSGRLGQFNVTSIKDQTFTRALTAAKSQYMRDFNLYMQKPGATAEQADSYAMGRFEKEFQRQDGRYKVSDIDPNNKNLRRKHFSSFLVAPTSAITHPMTNVRDIIRGNKDAIQTEGLLDKGELQRISSAAKAGKPFTIPKSAQYIANMYGGSVTASDVLNAQMKHYGIDQIPIKAYEQALSQVDPEYQRLLTYQPNQTRLNIASYGSGLTGGIPAKRQRGKVNSAGEIMSTFLAAGGDQKEAVLMTAIALAESSGRQDAARSDTDVHGWFQVRYPVHVDKLRALGISSRSELLDPLNNTKAALAIRKSQGLGAWEAYTNGAYKQYLPQAEAALKSFSNSPWRQGSTMNFNVVQYLTGDTAYRHPTNSNQFYYAADHGGSNYHEHVGFRSREDRDRAINVLRKHGVKIGSMNDGVHADGSLHYEDRAVDLPMPFNIAPGSREEQAYSRRVRQILGIPG